MAKPSANRKVRLTKLPNGVRVVSEQMTHVRAVSVGVWVDAGSRLECGGEQGISHFIEHMVFKGSAKRAAEQIAREMDALGGNLDAFTGKELVSFNTKVLDEHLPIAFDVLSDMVLRPAFRAGDIAKEKGVILEELKMEADNPEYLVHETFSAHFWKDHPLGQPILGTKETIEGFDRRMIRDFYRNAYTPSNLLITAAGNLSHQQLVDLAGTEFGAMPAVEPRERMQASRSGGHIALRDKRALEQVHLILGVPAYPVAHPARFAAYVLNVLLGGSMSSRLFQQIREQRGLAYAVFSEINNYRDSGAMTIYAGTGRESLAEVTRLILKEFRKLKKAPAPAAEIDRAKSHLKGSVMLGLESTSSRMSNLARQELYFGRFATMDEVVNAIDAVTPEQVQQVAREFFQPEAITYTALGNLKGVKLLREDLDC